MAEQCHAAGVIFIFVCSWTNVAQVDKFMGHFFAFASSWTKVVQTDKFRDHFFGFASSWTKVAQADKLKGRQCILLLYIYMYLQVGTISCSASLVQRDHSSWTAVIG